MSARWAEFQARWDAPGETLTEAVSEPVDTSTWPEVLRNNEVILPSQPGIPVVDASAILR